MRRTAMRGTEVNDDQTKPAFDADSDFWARHAQAKIDEMAAASMSPFASNPAAANSRAFTLATTLWQQQPTSDATSSFYAA